MDRTLLFLLIVSGLLLIVLAPHATLTVASAIALSVFTIRIIWSGVQSFEQTRPSEATD